MLLRSALNTSFFLSLLVVLVLVIVTSDSVANADRPESNLISVKLEGGKWTNNETSNVAIEWEANDPHNRKISRIYFWACYYENEGDCEGTELDKVDWELIHSISPNEANATGTTNISLNDFLSDFEEEEGLYKLITCAVAEEDGGIAEYGEENAPWGNGCSNRYKTYSHTTYFDSSKMEEFGFDKTAPEILIFDIKLYGNSPEAIDYTITDLAGIKNFTLEYKYESSGEWHEIYSQELTERPSEYNGDYVFGYKNEAGCAGVCGDGSYYLRINSTDRLGHYSEVSDNSIYDTVIPHLKDFSITEDGDDVWLEVGNIVTIEWDGYDSITNIESETVQIWYCLWESIISEDPLTLEWVGGQEYVGNTTNLTVSNGMPEGLYYFYPRLVDEAGNPSALKGCQGNEGERHILDKFEPVASLEPGESEKLIYNTETSISFSVSDNIELGNVTLWYAHSDEFGYTLSESNFSGTVQSYSSPDLSGNVTYDAIIPFDFPEGAGTYNFLLGVEDQNPFTAATEMTLTLIYDIEAPESQIVSSEGETDFTNLEKYSVNCRATDPNYEVGEVSLYFRYKEKGSHTFGNWSYGHATTYLINSTTGDCKIDFDFDAFAGDGYYQFHTVAIDRAGNEEEEKEDSELTIIRDKTSPEFELLYLESDAEEFLSLSANTIYYNSANMIEGVYQINITASLKDYLSDVNETSGISDHSWSWSEGFLSIGYDFNTSETDGNKTITLTISDLAGNPSEIVINFEEDNSAPLFLLYNSVLKQPVDDGEVLQVRSNETNIWITVFNSGSPVSSYELSLDDSEWSVLNPANPSFLIPSNKSKATIRVIDSLGNSISKNFVVEYDDEEPEFESLNPSNSWHYVNNIYYVSGPVTIELHASDSPGGLDRIEFRYEDGEWKEYNNSLNLFEEGGVRQLNFSYRGIDKLGNVKEHETTFIIDNTTTLIDFSLINFTLVANSGDASDNKRWNGSEEVDYGLFNTLRIGLANISDEGGAGISVIEVEYSRDNQTWTKYDDTTGIGLSSSSVYIRVTVTDNVGNTEEYIIGKPIEVINVPIEKEPESRSVWLLLAILLVVAAAGSVGVYKYRHTLMTAGVEEEAPGFEQEAVETEPEPASINCPNCSVLVSTESKSCNFCGCSWDDSGNVVLGVPLSTGEKEAGKEIIPRTGEILIGDGPERWKMDVGAKTSVGGRQNNEDSISWNQLIKSTNDTSQSVRLGIVADGVGGHNKGEIASSVAISALNESVSKSLNDPFRTNIFSPQEHLEILRKAYHDCNSAVYKLSIKEEYSGMATTAVSVYLWEEEGGSAGFLIGNIGDSRGYLINRNEIKQVTKDDSEVQKLVDSGDITEREARTHHKKNVITRAIGNKKKITPQTTTYLLEKLEYDTVLICSDGVSDRLGNAEIHKIVKKYDNPQDVCDRIAKVINRTNTNHDNISVICIKFPNLLVVD